ncbi:AAA family ATPase [Pontibacter diazotrophicus]|uniref:AAA family ATPase n=1 Tax=Pontibacter diazotrophicus TaxID=1400979 RepID=A0A3D8LIL3_9BACT|nr:AAA family ATPase [Pontibacter diazotrophicus]
MKQLLQQPEGLRLEFKEAKAALPANLFETICAFLNRCGGDILLGVTDDGTVTGIDADKVEQLTKDLVNLTNNAQKLDPPFILHPVVYTLEGATVVHVQVPESSQVHKSKGVVFDRSSDGDYRLTHHTAIAELYNRKSTSYTENTIYPGLRFSDFRPELFPKVRNLIRSRDYNHPWLALDDAQLLHKAGLYRRDLQANREGYTLAAALLLGQDEIIQSALPHYKTDALVRRQNLDRYDDRLYVQTNLIDAYEQLMEFIAKHLPDKFFMEGAVRVSLRSKIFREVVANLLVHREFTNGFPAKLLIYADKVVTENATTPHTYGHLTPDNFSPFPKNPVIAKFFTQLGHVDELGSGILNVNKYLPHYTPGQKPVFDEGDIFRMTIPLEVSQAGGVSGGVHEGISEGINEGINEGISARQLEVLKTIVRQQRSKAVELSKAMDVSQATIERDIKALTAQELITYVGSKKKGKYIATEAGESLAKR